MKDFSDVSLDHLLIVTGLDLLDHRPSSEQQLDEPFRSRLVEELERSLVNRPRFKVYMRALDNVLGTRRATGADLSEDAYNSLLNNGLAVLSDHDLMRLGLDAAELWAIHICLKEDGGPYWKTVLADALISEMTTSIMPEADSSQSLPPMPEVLGTGDPFEGTDPGLALSTDSNAFVDEFRLREPTLAEFMAACETGFTEQQRDQWSDSPCCARMMKLRYRSFPPSVETLLRFQAGQLRGFEEASLREYLNEPEGQSAQTLLRSPTLIEKAKQLVSAESENIVSSILQWSHEARPVPLCTATSSCPLLLAPSQLLALSSSHCMLFLGNGSLLDLYSPEELNERVPWAASELSLQVRKGTPGVSPDNYAAKVKAKKPIIGRHGLIRITLTFADGTSRQIELCEAMKLGDCNGPLGQPLVSIHLALE